MEVSISKIGNSKGIRLGKLILEKYSIRDKVELIPEEGQIIIRPVNEPRKGWDRAFKEMHENWGKLFSSHNRDDQLFGGDVFEDDDREEWK